MPLRKDQQRLLVSRYMFDENTFFNVLNNLKTVREKKIGRTPLKINSTFNILCSAKPNQDLFKTSNLNK